MPFFKLARHTSARDGINSWMLFGCEHAVAVSSRLGPFRNRLRLAVLWRREAKRILDGSFRHGYTEEQRERVVQRLSYQYNEKLT